ncbi:hypothetical protein [Flavobacterium sp.]|uniref:hypothetical protein n=1 Tax=Flavobacterium sp. TaxID=239 RepID=UPI00263A3732|nr:hypothetical protein [Flavobacterium sp.]
MIKNTFLLSIYFCLLTNSYSQKNNEQSIADLFDKKVEEETLAIFNGRHNNHNYLTLSDTIHPFLDKNFVSGSISYDNQNYDNILIKYDIVNDNVLVKPKKQSDFYSLVLDSNKIDGFIINKKKYTNSANQIDLQTKQLKGFYEEIIYSNKITLLIKHQKTKIEIIDGNKIYSDFNNQKLFYLKISDKIYNANSKKELISIFPNYKKQINTYYNQNKIQEKFDNYLFKVGLIKFINQLLN